MCESIGATLWNPLKIIEVKMNIEIWGFLCGKAMMQLKKKLSKIIFGETNILDPYHWWTNDLKSITFIIKKNVWKVCKFRRMTVFHRWPTLYSPTWPRPWDLPVDLSPTLTSGKANKYSGHIALARRKKNVLHQKSRNVFFVFFNCRVIKALTPLP